MLRKNLPLISWTVVLVALLMAAVSTTAMSATDGLVDAPSLTRETTSLLSAIVKVIGSLAVVVGLMLLVMMLIKKMGFGRGRLGGDSLINVVDNRMIAPKRYVAVLEIAGQFLAVGVTDKGLHPLASLEPSPELLACAQQRQTTKRSSPTDSFSAVLTKAAKGLGRRSSEDE